MRQKVIFLAVTALAAVLPAGMVRAQDLTLAADGRCDYQVVIPDQAPNDGIAQWLNQTALLFRAAFAANGYEVPVVAEAGRDPAKPGIYLGDTAFARAAGVSVSDFNGWGYLHRAVGRNIIVAGRDHAPPVIPEAYRRQLPLANRVGTVKAAADFLRLYLGVRFLYPDLGPRSPSVADAAGVEFLATPSIRVPANLDVRHEPMLRNNVGHVASNPSPTFYDIANNLFPMVDDALLAHTWDKAVPREKYAASNPEYFALRGGKREPPEQYHQYCLSNPGFQELVYQWTRQWLDWGLKSVNILQPDGFSPCQCEDCRNLYGTGDDWGEKIWIFNLKIAERLKREAPGGILSPIPYGPVAKPPKTFDAFPDNVVLQFIGNNEEDLQEWKDIKVPAGITSGLHNWIPNLGTRYTPMRTPLFLEAQAKRFQRWHITSTFRDGVGVVYGLEGPAYYVWGRMFDDPENNRAADLLAEFVEGAFGSAAAPMRRFYDQLYHGLELYANYLGTRNPAWSYTDIYGRGRKHLSDPFQLLGFLYTPNLLDALERELVQAEQAATPDKARARLALVRREFDYVRSLARVIHLYDAHLVVPGDSAVYGLLLDAIDARNAEIEAYYDTPRGATGWRPQKAMPGWETVLFPPGGNDAAHLRLVHNTYQGPFRDTPLNWDTAALRAAPAPGAK